MFGLILTPVFFVVIRRRWKPKRDHDEEVAGDPPRVTTA
jgi:hypothetical protein